MGTLMSIVELKILYHVTLLVTLHYMTLYQAVKFHLGCVMAQVKLIAEVRSLTLL